jgi:hypothetical protein
MPHALPKLRLRKAVFAPLATTGEGNAIRATMRALSSLAAQHTYIVFA